MIRISLIHRALVAPLFVFALTGPSMASEALDDAEIGRHSRALLFGAGEEVEKAIPALQARGKPDVAAAFILAARHRQILDPMLSRVLRDLTGHDAAGWFEWMVWQEANPQVKPHPSFVAIKQEVLATIDAGFLQFLGGHRALPEAMRIRLEEITWGGVRVDGIPSLDNPELIGAAEADYLIDTDLVFGVEINGDARAYPLRIMGWHEMFNEVIGGVPVALAYCTLCGSGILYETQVEGRAEPFVFGSSGLLYRSNKLMFDRQTNSLWNQFTGRPVVGPLVDSGIELKIRPVAITSWQKWRERHPETRVLSLETGHQRDYGSGVVYSDYFGSPNLMFPAALRDGTGLRPKDYVFGIRRVGASKAWPLTAFKDGAVINDTIGGQPVTLVGDEASRTVRAYDRGDATFEKTEDPAQLAGPGGRWQVAEDALIGPDGARLPRVPGHVAYWFAWDGYLGAKSELYDAGG